MASVLFVYYSFTGEASRVVERAEAAARATGFEVFQARVDFEDEATRPRRPLSPASVKRWTKAAMAGHTEPVIVDPPEALTRRYDLVCLVSNTWQHHPCVPIRSVFRRPDLRRILNGTPFCVYVVCRRSWELNLDIVRREAEECGGHYVAGAHFQHDGSDIGSLIRTVSYLMTTGDRTARLLGWRLPLPEYGLPRAALDRVESFTRSIMATPCG